MNYEDERIIAFAKNKSQHDFITADELLSALKGEVFNTSSEHAPVTIHAADVGGDLHLLKMVYKCGSCQTLHFEAGLVNPKDILIDERSIIYADYTHSPMSYVSRMELIEILEKIIKKNGNGKKIDIRTSDDNSTFPLTEVFKCSAKCPSVHLCTGYFEEDKK